jgi:hypothetical protein
MFAEEGEKLSRSEGFGRVRKGEIAFGVYVWCTR